MLGRTMTAMIKQMPIQCLGCRRVHCSNQKNVSRRHRWFVLQRYTLSRLLQAEIDAFALDFSFALLASYRSGKSLVVCRALRTPLRCRVAVLLLLSVLWSGKAVVVPGESICFLLGKLKKVMYLLLFFLWGALLATYRRCRACVAPSQ